MDQVLGTQHLTSPEHPPYHSLLLRYVLHHSSHTHYTLSPLTLFYTPSHLSLYRELKTQIEALGSERGVVSGSHDNRPIYELYARTESTKFSHVSKVRT